MEEVPVASRERAAQQPRSRADRSGGASWLFLGLCFYLLSQAYLVPIATVGPSWAVWPQLPDVAVAVLIVVWALKVRSLVALPRPNRRALVALLLLFLYCASSYGLLTIVPALRQLKPWDAKGVTWGAWEVARLAQVTILFALVSCIPVTEARLRLLRALLTGVLILVCTGILLTFFRIVDGSHVAAHLPVLPGPWYEYKMYTRGLGTNGYNHGYVGCHVILLFTLVQLTARSRRSTLSTFLLLLSAVSVFMTGSRACLGVTLVLGVCYFAADWRRTRAWWSSDLLSAAAVALIVTVLAVVSTGEPPIADPLVGEPSAAAPLAGEQPAEPPPNEGAQPAPETATEPDHIVRRQLVPEEVVFAFTSRVKVIWGERMRLLLEKPTALVWGVGFGAALESGPNAHLLPLHILLELGLLGLCLVVAIFAALLRQLWRVRIDERVLFTGTVILLITGLTQETFYPLPSKGHLLGLYLCGVALALRARNDLLEPSQPDDAEQIEDRRPTLATTESGR